MEEFTKKKRMNLSDFETTYSNDRKKQKTSFTNENNDYSNTINVQTGKAFSQRYYDILEKRKELPAWAAKETLKKLLEENQVVILQGETGSGKTTQVPQFLVDLGYTNRYIYIE